MISSRFVGKINFDEVVNSSLQDMGNITRASRVSLFLFNNDKSFIKETNHWSNPKIGPKFEKFQTLHIETISWWLSQVEEFSFVHIREGSELPPEAINIKRLMKYHDIQSFLAFPLKVSGKLTGFISISKIHEKKIWKGKDFALLRMFAEILGNAMERLQSEKDLRKSRELLRATFEATADGIIAIKKNGALTNINARFAYMWRIPDYLIEQRNFKMILAYVLEQLKEPQKFLSKMEDLRKTSKDAYDMIFFKDGRVFEQYSCPLFREGKNVGRVWCFKDITEHQHAEQLIRESEKKYREAYEQADFFKDLFTHDMNNIFHNIQASAELFSLLKDKSKNIDDLSEFFEIFQSQVDRGVKLIDNIRKLSKIEESDSALEAVEIHKVLDESIIFANKSNRGKEVNIQVNNSKKEYFVQANEFLLDVFENILHNAVKYNEKPTIDVQISVSKVQNDSTNYLKMEFMDNGIGIPDENKDIIFQKGHKKDHNIRGMGIGLSLVKKIIESYHGKIWVENRVKNDYSQGSNFIVLIPEAI